MNNDYQTVGETTVIFVVGKNDVLYEVIIDTEDLAKVEKYGKLRVVFNSNNTPYIACSKEADSPMLHRKIVNAPKGLVVDHINHNTLDNRKINLRIVSQERNMENKIRNCKFVVAYWEKKGDKWEAKLLVDNMVIGFGAYETEEMARKVSMEARKPYLPEVI